MVGVCYNLHYRDEAWDSVFFLGHLSSKQAEHEPAQPYSSKFKFHLISITCLSNNTVVALFGFPALTYYLVCFTSWIHFCFLAKWIKNFNARTKVQEWHRFFFFLKRQRRQFFLLLKKFKWKEWLFKFQNCVPFMALSYHQLNRHEFEQTLGDSEGQGSLECCSPWGHKELDITYQLKNIIQHYMI